MNLGDSVFEIRPLVCSELAKNPKNDNDVTIFQHDFLIFFVFLVNFSDWFKFHCNFITGSGILTILFYKGLTRNSEIRNTPVWVLPIIWILGWVMYTKFGANVSIECYWILRSTGVTAFTVFVIFRKNQLGGGGGKITPTLPTQIRVRVLLYATQRHHLNVFRSHL